MMPVLTCCLSSFSRYISPSLCRLATVGLLVFCSLAGTGCSKESDTEEISATGKPEAADQLAVEQTDWPWWRGFHRTGIAADNLPYPVPQEEREHLLWKVEVPGRGLSSPVICGERVFLTTAEKERQVQSVLCFDRQTGELQWRQDVHQGTLGKVGHPDNSYASSTPACDGHRLFAVFRNNGRIFVTALDLDGKQLWQTEVGQHDAGFGFGTSPLIYRELVIVAADSPGHGFLAALHRETGKIFWRKKRPPADSYASPALFSLAGIDQILLPGGEHIRSYDPLTGEELWSVRAGTKTMCGTITREKDTIFCSGGYPKRETVAVKVDSSGGTVLWRKNLKVYVPSLLVHDGCVYGADGSAFYCLDTATGETLWRLRLSADAYGSPVLAGGKLYVPTRDGRLHIMTAGREKPSDVVVFQAGEEMDTTPAACNGRLYLRAAERLRGKRQEWLFCFGPKA